MIKRWFEEEGIYFIKAMLSMGLLIVVAIVLSTVLSGPLQEREQIMVENGEVLPATVLELIGMQQLRAFPPKMEIFLIALMVANLIVMGCIIGHSVHSVRESIKKGAFAFHYVQVMQPWQYYIMVVLRTMCSALLIWGIYVIEVLLAAGILCNRLSVDVLPKVQAIVGAMAVRGIAVVMLMVAIGVLYGIKQDYRMHGVDFGLCLIGVSFIVSNAYKIPQYFGQKQIDEMVNAQDMMNLAFQMKQVRFVCPFAWLNPFNIYHNILETGVLWSYGLVAVGILVAAGVVFWKRDWWEL